MIIRKIREQDKSPLLNIFHEFHIRFHREELLGKSSIYPFLEYKNPDKQMRESVKELFKKKMVVFVAQQDEKIIAYISGKIEKREGKILDTEGYIDDWFIRKDFRNKGLGKKLFDAIVEEFRNRKCTHLGLTVYTENKKALDFYHHLGFKDFMFMLKREI